MTSNNEDKPQTVNHIDIGGHFDLAKPDWGSGDKTIEWQHLANPLTQHMTATWGR